MKDPGNKDENGVVFTAGELGRRLLRRATQPIGVINVDHAARLHSRSSLWREPSLKLLDTWKVRYGLNQTAENATHLSAPGAEGMPLIVPPAPAAALARSLDFPSVRSSLDTAGSPVITNAASKTSAPPQYRVRRPQSLEQSKASDPPLAKTIQAASTAEIQDGKHSVSSLLLRKADSQLPPSDAVDYSAIPIMGRTDIETSPPASQPAPGIGERPLNPQVSGREVSYQQIREQPSAAGPMQMPLRRKRDESKDPRTSGRSSMAHQFTPATMQLWIAASASDNGTSVPYHLQGKADSSAFATAQTAQRPAGPSSTTSRSREALSAEIAPAATSMVWRKAEGRHINREAAVLVPTLPAGPTHTNGLNLSRAEVAEPAASDVSTATAVSKSSAVDVANLADEVSRIIARRLTVERERRGRTR